MPATGCDVWTSDSLTLTIADYAATVTARIGGDSLIGAYRNVGNRGPANDSVSRRARPLAGRAPDPRHCSAAGTPRTCRTGAPALVSSSYATDPPDWRGRYLQHRDYGHFSGSASKDSFELAHFDGSFVYLLTGRLDGDTLRGMFHAGLHTQTPWKAVRSTGRPHLKSPTEITAPIPLSRSGSPFPTSSGRQVRSDDARFRGKVVLVDIFGSWCPTCHEAAPLMVRLYRKYHPRGLEIVGLAYEVSGDTAIDAARYAGTETSSGSPFRLLLAGINDTEAAAALCPSSRASLRFPPRYSSDGTGGCGGCMPGFTGLQRVPSTPD